MKFKSIIGSAVLVAASFMFISIAPAQAGDCSAEDPCQTWAMIDDTGLVTNIIVCQPSVCGSGEFAGSKVALQVPANPVTHQSQGGYWGGPDPQSPQAVYYNSETELFTRGSETFPANVTKIEKFEDGTSITTLKTTVKSQMVGFGPNDFVNGEMKFTPIVDDQTGAELYAYHYVSEGLGNASPTVQTITFDSPKTKDEITEAIVDNDLNLLFVWIDELLAMLDNWVKP